MRNLSALLILTLWSLGGYSADVTATVRVAANEGKSDPTGVVISLTSLDPAKRVALKEAPMHPALVQKNKSFSPHLLVIPPGSTVDFPNRDPFFHNVFSLFEGKRFDLGLYESGTTRSVKFDKTGVSYIFCNIHPQMNAIVISLDTPYYAIVGSSGEARIANVEPGEYQMQVWAEGLNRDEMDKLSSRVSVGDSPLRLGTLEIPSTETLAQHNNKYGRPYDPNSSAPYQH
ncbi:MAG TPA: hypothetical protein VG498_03975 [Terriglobales bacterium]|nr:hypothetical protein [Terriglobales bacterium]